MKYTSATYGWLFLNGLWGSSAVCRRAQRANLIKGKQDDHDNWMHPYFSSTTVPLRLLELLVLWSVSGTPYTGRRRNTNKEVCLQLQSWHAPSLQWKHEVNITEHLIFCAATWKLWWLYSLPFRFVLKRFWGWHWWISYISTQSLPTRLPVIKLYSLTKHSLERVLKTLKETIFVETVKRKTSVRRAARDAQSKTTMDEKEIKDVDVEDVRWRILKKIMEKELFDRTVGKRKSVAHLTKNEILGVDLHPTFRRLQVLLEKPSLFRRR